MDQILKNKYLVVMIWQIINLRVGTILYLYQITMTIAKKKKISGVNTFRALIECLSGKSIIRAEEKNYLIYGSSEPSIFDISEEVKATIKP